MHKLSYKLTPLEKISNGDSNTASSLIKNYQAQKEKVARIAAHP